MSAVGISIHVVMGGTLGITGSGIGLGLGISLIVEFLARQELILATARLRYHCALVSLQQDCPCAKP